MAETREMQVAQVVREARAPWHKANIYGVFLCVCVRASRWWTFTAGSLVFIILPVSTLMAESPSPLRSNRLILILTACVTHRTHVCFPFINWRFLSHTLADDYSWKPPSIMLQWHENIISEMLIILNFPKAQALRAPDVLVKMDLLLLCVMAADSKCVWLWPNSYQDYSINEKNHNLRSIF